MVHIILSRCGMKNTPHYRVVAADSRSPGGGKVIEILGSYNPKVAGGFKLKKERLEYWLKAGAKASKRVMDLMKLATNSTNITV